MNDPRPARSKQRRRPQGQRPAAASIWRTPPPLPDVEPITVPAEPGVLLRSLGDPPMSGSDASRYFTGVVERAAAVAAALALSADLLAGPDDA
jgi:hypothetical protein